MCFRNVVGFVIVLAAAGAAPQLATAPASGGFVAKLRAGAPQKVVFFGTSLTQYGPWVGQVTQALDAAFPHLVTTFNGAKAGQNSAWGIEHLQTNVIDQKPDAVFIEFTVNDAVERFHLSVETARKNLESMLDQIHQARPDCQVILQITNPVVGKPKGDFSHREDLPAYQQMYRDVGKGRGLLVIDHMPAWQALLDQGEEEFRKYVPDGVHPNGPGCEKFVTPTILTALGLTPAKARD